MSQDFIGGLHDDLVEAMDRYERRTRRGRLAAGHYPRLLRRATVVRVAAAAAIIIAFVAVARTLAPPPRPVRPHVVATLQIGGEPIDAALADGSLWVGGFGGSIVQIDPGERRVVGRVQVPGDPASVAVGAGSVWVPSAGPTCGDGRLVRIDARTRRILSQTRLSISDTAAGKPAVAGGGVWVTQGRCHQPQTVDRRDYAGATTSSVELGRIGTLAGADGNLWALGIDGTVTQLDARTGHILHRWPGRAPFVAPPSTLRNSALVADGDGVWVLSPGSGAIVQIRDGRVAQRIAVDTSVQPMLAKASDGLWIATGDHLGGHNRLIRVDPASGEPTGTVDLGMDRPAALIATADQLCVVTSNGKVLFVES